MTGRKVDFKREYALTFREYVEARDPKVVSNSMAPRTEPCIALYPTLNANGSWKLYNLGTNKLVSRSRFVKMKCTPENIIQAMNTRALKGMVKASDIDQADPVDIEEIADEPVLVTHAPDPNVVEIIQHEDDDDDPEGLVEQEEVDEVVAVVDHVEPNIDSIQSEIEEEIEVISVQPTRRSTRLTAGQTSKYEPYSMLTQGYGLALGNLRIKVVLERFGKVAYDSIKEELEQLFVKKKALAPVLYSDIARVNLYFPILRSHMFLREKFNALAVFEKIKARLVADGSSQDREDFDDEEISSPTACLESIFNMLKLVAVEKRHLLILDVGGAYLNAKIDRPAYMFIQPDLANILLNICPHFVKFKDGQGRILTQIDRAMYGLVQSAKLWYRTITGVLEKDGYVPNPMDACVWNKTVKGIQTTIVIYVDDLAISSKNREDVHAAMELIKKEFFDVKVKESTEMSYL